MDHEAQMRQGGCFHPALAFSGFMDDFRIYSIDVSSIDLKTDANCTLRTPTFKLDTNFKYLTAYLNFDEVGDIQRLCISNYVNCKGHDLWYAGSTRLLRWHQPPYICPVSAKFKMPLG